MSHELTITVGIDGKFYNIKTSRGHGKKPMTDKEAIDFAIKTKTLGIPFKTQQEAVEAAKKRSHSFNNKSRLRKALGE